MAKENRVILKGVVLHHMPDTTFIPGMEDELEKEMTADQLKRLEETGSVAGDWSAKGSAVKMSGARPDKLTPAPRKAPPDITSAAVQGPKAGEKAAQDTPAHGVTPHSKR